MRRLGFILLPLFLAAGCAHHRLEPYRPVRPFVNPDWMTPTPVASNPELFPERTLLDGRKETAPQTLARIENVLGQIGEIRVPEPAWRRSPLEQEIDSIRKEVDGLGISTLALLHQRLGKPNEREQESFRNAAALYMRWGLAMMRTGEVNQRIWGADKIRQAVAWDPENPIPLLVLAEYMELAGYWSNELELLNGFTRDHGRSDLVDLQRLRARERAWKVTREPAELDRAFRICGELAERKGSWKAAPPWLQFERARLYYEADSTEESERSARLAAAQALPAEAAPAGVPDTRTGRKADAPDTLTGAQAELLLGVLGVRNLEFEAADGHFRRAMALAAACPSLSGLASWMMIPWDLWTADERMAFDHSAARREFVERFWRRADPILATPTLEENLVEYRRRVGEAWFSLSGVDPGTPGPLTDPGRVILRFGVPRRWTSTGGEERAGLSAPGWDFGVNRSWRFTYRFGGSAGAPITILFQDAGSASRFAATDSLTGPPYPPFAFDDLLAGKSYRLDTSLARFREPDGGIRLVLSYDTYLPDYAVRFPMQGMRFTGEVSVHSTLLRYTSARAWIPGPQVDLALNRETVVESERVFRRRSAWIALPSLREETVRLASELFLRDARGRIVAMAVDNGTPGQIHGFGSKELDASDLLLFSALSDTVPEESQRTLAPGLVAYGPDPEALHIIPRASRSFLPGEDLGFYLEVYNIDAGGDATSVDLATSLQRLREDGTMEYAVSLRGGQYLTRPHVNQWNVIRSVGLGGVEPGRYRLLVAAFDRRASREVVRAVEFSVVEPKDLVRLYNWAELPAPLGESQ